MKILTRPNPPLRRDTRPSARLLNHAIAHVYRRDGCESPALDRLLAAKLALARQGRSEGETAHD